LAIPLAWNPDTLCQAQAIEVYPAATLRSRRSLDEARKIKHEDKAKQKVERRRALAALLSPLFDGGLKDDVLAYNAHAFDAVVCVLAGADFLRGKDVPPEPQFLDQAIREGWIWVKEIGD
jgi:Protein of unknown function (DUF429)